MSSVNKKGIYSLKLNNQTTKPYNRQLNQFEDKSRTFHKWAIERATWLKVLLINRKEMRQNLDHFKLIYEVMESIVQLLILLFPWK